MKIKDKIFISCNILVVIISLLICIHFQKSAYIICHDYFYYNNIDITHPIVPRIPGLLIGNLFNEKLPMLLGQNLQDFKCGIGNYITSFIYVFICLIFAKGFFIFDNKSMFLNKRFSLIYPISFIFLSIPLLHELFYYAYFNQISEVGVWGEYCAGYIVYFSFWLLIIKNLSEDKKDNGKNFILKSVLAFIVAFLIGFWSELFSVTTLFGIIPFIIYLWIFSREKLKNSMLKILFFGFFIGFISLVLVELKIGTLAAQPDFTLDMIGIDFFNFKRCIVLYSQYILINNLVFFISLFITFLILICKIKANKTIIFLLFCIIFGYFMSNFSTIFLSALDFHKDLFLNRTYVCIEINILEFVLLIATGMIISNENGKIFKIILNCIIICAFVLLNCIFFYNYKKCVFYRNQFKSYSYKIEKMILIYRVYGEAALLPYQISFNKWNNSYHGISEVIPMTNQFNIVNEEYPDKNRYLDALYYNFYIQYWNKNYKKNFIGVIFKDDEIAEKEFNKRLMYLGEKVENDKELIKKRIKFGELKKYDNIDLTLQDIENMGKKYGQDDILIKAKAYIYFKNSDYNNALDLYKLYLSKHPGDFDALINLSTMYKEKGDLKNYEKYLQKLLNADTTNINHLYKMVELLYEKKDYDNAIRINNEIIKLYPQVRPNYINGAALYKKSGDIALYNEFLDKIKNQNQYIYKKIKQDEGNLILTQPDSMFI